METRIIRIYKGRIFLTPNDSFGLDQTTFPSGAAWFKGSTDVYWEVERILDEATGLLTISVVNYDPEHTSKFQRQTLSDGIKKLTFKGLVWSEFKPLLSYFTPNQLLPYCPDVPIESSRPGVVKTESDRPVVRHDDIKNPLLPEQTANPPAKQQSLLPITRVHSETFECKFEDARFFQGRVDISISRLTLKVPSWISVHNTALFEEINYVTAYLPKVFKKSTFTVFVEFTFIDGDLTGYVSSSPEIAQIDEAMFKRIVLDCIQKLPRLSLPKSGKTVYTGEDLLGELSALKNAAIAPTTSGEIVAILIEQSGARNAEQLSYLASTLQSNANPMLFTLSPLFGFLFFIETEQRFSFCWELLNSHATYVWTFPHDYGVQDAYRRIETIISNVHLIGRKQYRGDYRKSLVDMDISFRVVEHPTNDFKTWKGKLNASFSGPSEQEQYA